MSTDTNVLCIFGPKHYNKIARTMYSHELMLSHMQLFHAHCKQFCTANLIIKWNVIGNEI